MCGGDGGGGGDGVGSPTGPGTGGGGGNPSGGSGGNVGPGAPGAGGGATGRGDQGQQGAVGAPGTPSGPGGGDISSEAGFEGAQGQFGGLNAGEQQAQDTEADLMGDLGLSMDLSDLAESSGQGALGFNVLTGLLTGAKLGGLIPGGIIGAALGLATGEGNVSDYGGGDPDAGGGPWAGDPTYMDRFEDRGDGSGDDSDGWFFGGGGGSGYYDTGDNPEDSIFALKTSAEPGNYLYRSLINKKDKGVLGGDILFEDLDKFTRSLF